MGKKVEQYLSARSQMSNDTFRVDPSESHHTEEQDVKLSAWQKLFSIRNLFLVLTLFATIVVAVVTNSLMYFNSAEAVRKVAQNYRTELLGRIKDTVDRNIDGTSIELAKAIEYLENRGFCVSGVPGCNDAISSEDWLMIAHKVVLKHDISTFYLATQDYGVIWGAERLNGAANPAWLLYNNYTMCADPARVPGTKCDLVFRNIDQWGLNPSMDPATVPFEPRGRPWYTQITESQSLARGEGRKWTAPYLSVTADVTQDPVLGVTLSGAYMTPATAHTANPVMAGVAAADIYFLTLSNYIGSITIGKGGVGCAFITNQALELMASSSNKQYTLFEGVGKDVKMLTAAKSGDPRISGAAKALIRDIGDLQLLSSSEVKHLSFNSDGTKYVASAVMYSDRNGLKMAIFVVLPVSEYLSDITFGTNRTLIIAAGVVLAALILSVIATRVITKPLERFTDNVSRLGRLELEASTTGSNIREIREMETALNKTRKGLRSFTKFVPARVVRQLLASPDEEIGLGVKPRVCVVLFCDVVGFTRITESMPPFKLIGIISEVFAIITGIIESNNGVVDKFIGDAIMAFWGAPVSMEGGEDKAALAALQIQAEIAKLRAKWDLQDGMPKNFRVRIGVHSGPVLAGIVGAPSRFAYTVVGDTVNIAARLESICKVYSTGIICSAVFRSRTTPGRFITRKIDRTTLPGRPGNVDLVEIVDVKNSGLRLSARAPASVDSYEEGMQLYLERNFSGALAKFQDSLASTDSDRPCEMMIERCIRFIKDPPPPDWDGNAHDLNTNNEVVGKLTPLLSRASLLEAIPEEKKEKPSIVKKKGSNL